MQLAHTMTFVAALLVGSSYATAQTAPQSQSQSQPQQQQLSPQQLAALQACKPDIDKLCKDVQPGGGRIAACLHAHATDLSADCKATVAAAHNQQAK